MSIFFNLELADYVHYRKSTFMHFRRGKTGQLAITSLLVIDHFEQPGIRHTKGLNALQCEYFTPLKLEVMLTEQLSKRKVKVIIEKRSLSHQTF